MVQEQDLIKLFDLKKLQKMIHCFWGLDMLEGIENGNSTFSLCFFTGFFHGVAWMPKLLSVNWDVTFRKVVLLFQNDPGVQQSDTISEWTNTTQ